MYEITFTPQIERRVIWIAGFVSGMASGMLLTYILIEVI